ncbi:MAG: TolC family protein [Myxococcales bacterium]|nr:TolC family protein [Myxococcales bacterium]
MVRSSRFVRLSALFALVEARRRGLAPLGLAVLLTVGWPQDELWAQPDGDAPPEEAAATISATAPNPLLPAADESSSSPVDQGPAGTYDLETLLALARQHNPGLGASRSATAVIRGQLSEAKRSWLPTGEFTSLLAPSPNIRCLPSIEECRSTGSDNDPNIRDPNIGFSGLFTRTQITLAQPVYTFGKISAGIDAAEAGVEASKSRERGAAAELELNVKRAYYGFKLAREVEATLREGLDYVKQAEDMVQKDLDEGGGNMTVTDKLRLQTTRAEVEAQLLEVSRGADVARNGIKALIGPDGPKKIVIDKEPLETLTVPVRPLSYYEEIAMLSRPEVRALSYFVRAQENLAKLATARLLPDIVILATANYAYASSVDDPFFAFANDPYNNRTVGAGAALRVPLDFGQRDAQAKQARSSAQEAAFRRREALGGIAFEVSRAYLEMTEAKSRIEALARGEKLARRWMTSIVQKMDLGLAETREVTDALRSYFTMRVRYLQSVHDFNVAVAALARATGSQVAS